MHNRGLLVRTHGGAIKATRTNFKVNLNISHLAEKQRIANLACETIEEGDIIAVGGGTTTLCLARALLDVKNIIVVTNSIYVAYELQSNRSIEVHLSGGVLRMMNGTCVGARAEELFHNISVAKSYIGVDAVNKDSAFTTMNPDERSESSLLRCAQKRYVLLDHTKFEKGPYLDCIATFEDIDACITGKSVSPEHIAMLQKFDIEVMLA